MPDPKHSSVLSSHPDNARKPEPLPSGTPGSKPLLHRSVPRPVAVAVFCLLVLFVPALLSLRNILQEARRSEAFLPDLETEAKQHTTDARLMALLGARYAEAGEYARAADALQQSIGAGMRDPIVFEAWAAALAAQGDAEKAGNTLQFAIQSGRCQPQDRCRAALDRFKAAEAAPSPTPATLAHAISPDGPKQLTAQFAGANWASALLSGDGFTRREADARTHPDDVAAQLRWADALRLNHRNREAETLALDLVRRYPKFPEAHLLLGDILFAGGVRAKAGLQYKAALALRPDDVAALKGLGSVGVELRLLRLAIDNYEKAVKLAPNDAQAWAGLGRAYLNEQFQFDKAVSAFATAVRLDPHQTDFYPYYSDALSAVYKTDEAEQLLARRLHAAPEDARSHYLLGRLLIKNKVSPERTAQAEEHLRTSLKLEPNAPAVRVTLAQLLLDKGDANSAADAGVLLSEANEQDPLDPLAMRLLAVAFRRIGRADRAKEAEDRARALAAYKTHVDALEDRERSDPRDIKVHQDLAALYTSGGETDKANRQSEMAYMLIHHPEAAQKGLTTLNQAVTKTGQVDKDTRK